MVWIPHWTAIEEAIRTTIHCFEVQIDFTEGRSAVKFDSAGSLQHSFIDLNNLALSRFSAEDRQRIGMHTCPGGDWASTHSGDVPLLGTTDDCGFSPFCDDISTPDETASAKFRARVLCAALAAEALSRS